MILKMKVTNALLSLWSEFYSYELMLYFLFLQTNKKRKGQMKNKPTVVKGRKPN